MTYDHPVIEFHLFAMNSNQNLFTMDFLLEHSYHHLISYYHHHDAVLSPDLFCSQLANHC